MNSFAILTISLRVTERLPTSDGPKLDRVRDFEGTTRQLWGSLVRSSPLELTAPGPAKLTAVMRGAVQSMFGDRFVAGHDRTATIALDTDGCSGHFRIDHVVACSSTESDAGQVEGDDCLFTLFLERIPGADGARIVRLDERLRSTGEVWLFLKAIGVLAADLNIPKTGGRIPGFYLVSSERIEEKAGADFAARNVLGWLNDEALPVRAARRQAASLINAYLFYCWLICQRTERHAMALDVNGDWDAEWRRLILARKKLATGRKFAFIKNRAQPDSPILPVFWGLSLVYRLEEQIESLTELIDTLASTLETQNGYVSSRRLRAIELIIFASTILGLGVAINAIQMPPFYDSSAVNALSRPVFWLVNATVALVALAGAWIYTKGRMIVRNARNSRADHES